jgi:hypothetical protein
MLHAWKRQEMHTEFWLENLEGKRQPGSGRPRHRWEDDIRTNLREIEWESMDGIHLAEGEDQW